MLDKVTSLFDFLKKAETCRYHKRLAVITAKRLSGNATIRTYKVAKEWLIGYVKLEKNCHDIVDEANFSRYAVKDTPAKKRTKSAIAAVEPNVNSTAIHWISDDTIMLESINRTVNQINRETNPCAEGLVFRPPSPYSVNEVAEVLPTSESAD